MRGVSYGWTGLEIAFLVPWVGQSMGLCQGLDCLRPERKPRPQAGLRWGGGRMVAGRRTLVGRSSKFHPTNRAYASFRADSVRTLLFPYACSLWWDRILQGGGRVSGRGGVGKRW